VAGNEDDPHPQPLPESSESPGDNGKNSPDTSANPHGSELSTEPTDSKLTGSPTTVAEFGAGEVIDHRYNVVRFLGRGAMGEVYEVHDSSLNESVALKLLSAAIASDKQSIARFKREISLARKVTHRNVCRVHEFGDYTIASISVSGETTRHVSYITMELLDGPTLYERVRARGKMEGSEALPLAEQLAKGLDAAHRAKIIHRDFKCGNVMLVPAEEGERAVITDFGLARTESPKDDGSLSSHDQLIGTLDYMSPEQVRSEEATSASDIYSFGVVMYFMLTGHLPFQGSTPRRRAMKRLAEPPSSPRKYVPGLDNHWEAAILQCLELQPKDRPKCGEDAVRIIRGEISAKRRSSGIWSRSVIASAISSLLLITVLAAIPSIRQKLWPHTTENATQAKQLAVLPFTSVNTDEQGVAFARGLAETITARLTKLTEKHALEIIPTREIASSHIDTLEQARREFGVNLGIEGSVERSGDMVRVTYHLVNAQNAHQIRADMITAPAADPFRLEDDVATSIASALEIELNPQEQEALATMHGTEPGAYQYFLRGRGYLQEYLKPGNLDSAISVFNSALAIDQNYAPAHAGLGEAFWYKYETTNDQSWISRAKQACEQALALEETSAEAHECLGTVYQGTGKFALAALQFQRAVELDSVSDDAVRGLATAYASMGRVTEAEETYRRAISLRPQNWLGYNMLGAFYYAHARYDDAADMFQKVVTLAPDNSRGWTNLGGIYLVQGKYADAVPEFQRAVAIQPSADAYSNLGTTYFYLRRFPEAARMFEMAVKLDDRNYVTCGNLADAEYRIPEWREDAMAHYRKAIQLAEKKLQVNPHDATILGNLADYFSILGDKTQALGYITRALSGGQSSASVCFRAAQVYLQIGNDDVAVGWIEKAIKAGYSRTLVRDSPSMEKLRSDPRVQAMLRS
jgi:serine/threonine protein kinase/tetratricopeptide (TPR) repeat protein